MSDESDGNCSQAFDLSFATCDQSIMTYPSEIHKLILPDQYTLNKEPF